MKSAKFYTSLTSAMLRLVNVCLLMPFVHKMNSTLKNINDFACNV